MQAIDRRSFLAQAAAATAPGILSAAEGKVEWRNKQSGMAYRKFGRTGIMISEVVSGGDPIRSNNWEHLNLAIEMGLNYLDMAPAYGNGDCEVSYGKLLGGSAKREKVFLTTKISAYGSTRNRMYDEIFKGLPADRQSAIRKRAEEMIAERGVAKPGYLIEYYPGLPNPILPTYLCNAMRKDYGHKVEGSKPFKAIITKSVEDSLKRVGTDYFDTVMCPHGAYSPEDLDNPEIRETLFDLRKQGKLRFIGVTAHFDAGGILRKAAQLGHYDVAMVSYNVINGGYVEHAMAEAHAAGMGVIAMKAAMAVATHHKPLQPIPQWRIDKVNRIVPGEMKAPMKAYLWALQNPHLTAVISNLWDQTFIRENLSIAGKRVELQPA
jgi:aryl-alcohol dehydrogenase-like predicted oxidoreductase